MIINVPTPDPAELLAAERAAMVCSALQARLALASAGFLAAVEAAVAASDTATQMAYEYAIEWKRNSAMVAGLAASLQLTPEQVDDLFRAAMQIEV